MSDTRVAIAGLGALNQRPHPVDRARMLARGERPVGPHHGAPALAHIDQFSARRDQPHLDQRAEGHARRGALGDRRLERRITQRLDRRDALQRRRDIGVVALDADEPPAELLRHCARRAGAPA